MQLKSINKDEVVILKIFEYGIVIITLGKKLLFFYVFSFSKLLIKLFYNYYSHNMLLHLLFFTLLLITSTISFTKHGYGKMYYPDGSAQFSPDN